MPDYTIRHDDARVLRNCRKSHATHARCDSRWEKITAQILDLHPDVLRWARNHQLKWSIPWVYEGQAHSYRPDFVAVTELPDCRELHVVIEVKGLEDDLDDVKRRWAESYWCPAINADPVYSDGRRWSYLYLDRRVFADAALRASANPDHPVREAFDRHIREEAARA